MRYLLLIYGDETATPQLAPEAMAAEMKRWTDYTDWLKQKGWHLGGEALHPTSDATTVREQSGKVLTTDGPFAETKEQLGGFYMVECKNLDEAIEAASKIPSVEYGGSVEVRPIMEFMES
jgi:hypothetical protein